MIVMYFPRRLALATDGIDCSGKSLEYLQLYISYYKLQTILLPWGIFGENISYCTIKRLIYQTIVSLMVSAAIAIFAGRTDNLFFCNVNIYRSTGTIDRHAV